MANSAHTTHAVAFLGAGLALNPLLMTLAPETAAKLNGFGQSLTPTTFRTLRGVGCSHLCSLVTLLLPLLQQGMNPLHAIAYGLIPRLIVTAYMLVSPDPTGGVDASDLVPIYAVLSVAAVGILWKPAQAVLCSKIMAGVYMMAAIPLLLAPVTAAKAMAGMDLKPGQTMGVLLENAKADLISGVAAAGLALGQDIATVWVHACVAWIVCMGFLDAYRQTYKKNLEAPLFPRLFGMGVAGLLGFLMKQHVGGGVAGDV